MTPELSTARKVQYAIAVGVFPLVGVIRSGALDVSKGGHVNVGAERSRLVMVNVQFDDAPTEFVALQEI